MHPSHLRLPLGDDGRPIEKLQEILGHSSVTVTERYAHLGPEMFTEADFAAVAVDLSQPCPGATIWAQKGGQQALNRVTYWSPGHAVI